VAEANLRCMLSMLLCACGLKEHELHEQYTATCSVRTLVLSR
jgi:hypothetical protein